MSAQSLTTTLFVGMDSAAKTVTATWTTDGSTSVRPLTVDQTAQGYALLHALLQATNHTPDTTLVVMEATGSSWMTIARTRVELGTASV